MAKEIEIKVPDIGGATQVDVIEILVSVGDTLSIDTPLITLESDKASMEIPAPTTGVVSKILTKVGDKVSEGSTILLIKAESGADEPNTQTEEPKKEETIKPVEEPALTIQKPVDTQPIVEPISRDIKPALDSALVETSPLMSAGPAVRRMARELGVDLGLIHGSGRKSRITKEDIQHYVKERLSEKSAGGNFNLPESPVVDFAKFGAIETVALNKIKKLTGLNVHRSWVTIPHVTQFDEADITDLEAFRKAEVEKAKNAEYKLTILAFVCRVVSKALQVYPQFNASLDASGTHLIYKKYCNIGIAVETPNGLVVPVIKNVDQLSVSDIAKEMGRLSAKAREKGLMPADMSGGCFTISSLGGIGGTAFTPIVNSPEVAILGLSRSMIKPVYTNGVFEPRLLLPLSLSYDHRVIDGAEAARFTRFIADALSDIRKILL